MSNEPNEKRLNEERLHNLLTTLILVADGYHWPGGDGLLVEDVLREYPRAARHGHVPSQENLCRRHPELTSAITDFFVCFGAAV